MTFASLFSGIGGADLAAAWVGWKNEFWCEIDPFCRKIMEYWFKDSKGYGDIKQTDFHEWRGKIDVLHGSAPCQAVSIAGKRNGDSDDRWLWGEMYRAIREIKPRWVTFENVANITNMVSSKYTVCVDEEAGDAIEGRRFLFGGEVLEDLEREGYSFQTFAIPASAVGAPHKRERIWLVAHRDIAHSSDARLEILQREREDGVRKPSDAADTDGFGRRSSGGNIGFGPIYTEFEWELAQGEPEWRKRVGIVGKDGENGSPSNADDERFKERDTSGIAEEQGRDYWRDPEKYRNIWEGFPTECPVRRRNDGFPEGMDAYSIPYKRWRNETIKAYGNALVPQVLYEIFKAIDEIDKIIKKED